MSIRIKDLSSKAGKVTNTTQIATEDPIDETGKTRKVPSSDLTPWTYAASDEDSPLSTGVLYTTEASSVARSILEIIMSLKNAPTGDTMEFDVEKETGVNTNTFGTVFIVRPTIMVGEFTSDTALPAATFNTTVWEKGRRMRIILITNDPNFAATGLKASFKS